jgi:hypothetical protein
MFHDVRHIVAQLATDLDHLKPQGLAVLGALHRGRHFRPFIAGGRRSW